MPRHTSDTSDAYSDITPMMVSRAMAAAPSLMTTVDSKELISKSFHKFKHLEEFQPPEKTKPTQEETKTAQKFCMRYKAKAPVYWKVPPYPERSFKGSWPNPQKLNKCAPKTPKVASLSSSGTSFHPHPILKEKDWKKRVVQSISLKDMHRAKTITKLKLLDVLNLLTDADIVKDVFSIK